MSRPEEPRRRPPGDPADANPPRAPKPRANSADDGWQDVADEALGKAKSRSTFRPNPKPESKAGPARERREPVPVTGGPKLVERILFGRVSTAHLASFCRQFATYSDAGVDLLKSIDALAKQFHRSALGPILNRISGRIRGGDTLSDAMADEPEAFDRLFLSMIRVAEARGGIPETMRGLADQYDARVRLIRQARSAMIYPIIVMVLAAGVVALMTYFLLPMFAELLADLARGTGGEGTLPLPSRIMMGLSRFVKSAGWWVIPLVAIGTIVGSLRWYGTRSGKAILDASGLRIPVLGKLLRLIETTRFARTLSSLLGAGVDMNASLGLTSEVLRLAPYQRAVADARGTIRKGGELSEAIEGSGRFTPDVVAVISTGEETGNLPETLDKMADSYEEQLTYMVKNLSSLIQPFIYVMLGLVVLFIILAVFLPYIAALTALSK